jgi:hypothetical protein
MTNRQTPCFIVSTHRQENDELTNNLNTAHELGSLASRGIGNKLVKGVFNGVAEDSILITDRDEAMRIMTEYNQDCILEIGSDRSAFFIYPNGNARYQGTWTSVDSSYKGDYTYDPTTKCKYTIKG